MKVVNIYEAKARLSEYLDLVEQGEHVLICRRNQPIAELRAVASARREPRPLGGGGIAVPAAFFEPLPDAVTAAFYGDPVPLPSAAAERRVTKYGSPLRRKRRPGR